MITTDHPLIELLALVDMVWQDSRPSMRLYSEQSMFKLYVVSLVKQLWSRRSVWLGADTERTDVGQAVGRNRAAGGASNRGVGTGAVAGRGTDGSIAASDGSEFEAAGAV
jgi:hypothetical protein